MTDLEKLREQVKLLETFIWGQIDHINERISRLEATPKRPRKKAEKECRSGT
jgi:hypothetical protein